MANNFQDKYANNRKDVAGIENLTKFDSFYRNKYLDPFVSGYSFVFVTRPSLFLYNQEPKTITEYENLAYENMKTDQRLSQFLLSDSLNDSDRIIIDQLSYHSDLKEVKNFLPLFTNRAKSFSTTDVTMNQADAYETKQGFRMILPTHKSDSEAANTLSINSFETANLDIMKTLNVWVNYISNITDGTFHANPNSVRNGVIDYMSSIYYLVLEPDGRTLKYWAKYTGCWPNTIPYANLSYNRGDQTLVETDVSFVYMSKEDMNPAILEDFNRVSLNYFTDPDQTNITEEYLSINTSKFLTKAGIRSIPTYDEASRNPLIFLSDSDGKRFELTFGITEYENNFEKNKFLEDYFANPTELFESNLDSANREPSLEEKRLNSIFNEGGN